MQGLKKFTSLGRLQIANKKRIYESVLEKRFICKLLRDLLLDNKKKQEINTRKEDT